MKTENENEKKEIKETKNCLNDIFAQIIGKDLQFETPIKDENNKRLKKFIIYTDYTASGKSIKSIESFIKHQVLPTYANVHSTVGLCAEMTSKYLQEAKDNLRKYTNSFGNYSIIFHGQGATGGVHKLIELLGIKKYESFYDKLKMAFDIKAVYGNDIVKTLKNNLIKEIKEQFKELFINTNFCNKIKDKESEKYKFECILCKQYFENEGHYHKHIQEKSHQKFLKDYEENPSQEALFEIKGRRIKDFIDIIKTKYNINSEKSILELINDYERFKPVVFYSLFEHNSNSLSWRETQCKIVLIDGDYNNFYDNLESKLTENEKYYIKIGSFTASSNITGLLLDVDKIASIIHNKQGFAFFDYAAAAPYLKIDMQEALPNDYRKKLKFDELDEYDKRFCYKDGLFFSPHKFVGGPNTPGVLITHDRIYRNRLKPTQPGGGTVNFVYNDFIDYIHDVELKEESGTPNIIGSIRLGLLMSLMSKLNKSYILDIERNYINLFMDKLENITNIYILHGNLLKDRPHVPVFSFMISYGDKFLHPSYISALLNDLFGIQSRPGCSCAPNYGKFLLGFDKDKKRFEQMGKFIHEGKEIFKPGYVRLNLPYFYPKYIIDYVIKSIEFICENGKLLLGLYKYDINSGKFYYHKSAKINNQLNVFQKNDFYAKENYSTLSPENLNKTFEETNQYIIRHVYLRQTFYEGIPKLNKYPEDFEIARWFCLFDDVLPFLKALYKLETNQVINERFDEEIINISQEFEEKAKIKKKDWLIHYQNEIHD